MPSGREPAAERAAAPDRTNAEAALREILARHDLDRSAFEAEKRALMELKRSRSDEAQDEREIG